MASHPYTTVDPRFANLQQHIQSAPPQEPEETLIPNLQRLFYGSEPTTSQEESQSMDYRLEQEKLTRNLMTGAEKEPTYFRAAISSGSI